MTSPIRGIPTTPDVGSGVPAASMFFEHLADADDAALMRLCGLVCVAAKALVDNELGLLRSIKIQNVKVLTC